MKYIGGRLFPQHKIVHNISQNVLIYSITKTAYERGRGSKIAYVICESPLIVALPSSSLIGSEVFRLSTGIPFLSSNTDLEFMILKKLLLASEMLLLLTKQ